jgi:hypothetical protein
VCHRRALDQVAGSGALRTPILIESAVINRRYKNKLDSLTCSCEHKRLRMRKRHRHKYRPIIDEAFLAVRRIFRPVSGPARLFRQRSDEHVTKAGAESHLRQTYDQSPTVLTSPKGGALRDEESATSECPVALRQIQICTSQSRKTAPFISRSINL